MRTPSASRGATTDACSPGRVVAYAVHETGVPEVIGLDVDEVESGAFASALANGFGQLAEERLPVLAATLIIVGIQIFLLLVPAVGPRTAPAVARPSHDRGYSRPVSHGDDSASVPDEQPVDMVRRLTAERDEFERQLRVVYSSRSWMLTEPLRRAARFARSRRSNRAATTAAPPPVTPRPDLPPPQLRYRVTGTEDADWFRSSGRMAVEDIIAALSRVGRSIEEFTSIYDFGCGCGRITVPLTARVGQSHVTATDRDSKAVAWLRGRLPAAKVQANEDLPPVPFADRGFDLIIGWSILTHLPEDYQDAWLAELARTLSPGGVMLQTVHGPSHFDHMDSPPSDYPTRNQLAEEGIIYYENYPADWPFASYYQTTYHHPDYIRERWSRWLRVLEILPGAARPTHDMVVLTAR